MKVLLLGFNVQSDVFPLGLSYLKSYALQFHKDVEIEIREFSFGNRYNYETNKTVELAALSYVALSKPDVVAFSSYIWSSEMVVDFACAIKRINAEIKVVVGGVEASLTLLKEGIDFVLVGEGEIAFKELLDYVKGERELMDVSNIVYRMGEEIVHGRESLITSLDEIPFPYVLEERRDYSVVRIETARGCQFDCSFCYYAQPKLRYYSLDYLRRGFDYLFAEYTFSYLTILDANFNGNKERMKRILEMIEKNCLKFNRKIAVHMEMRPELIDEATCTFLSKLSFSVSVELGLQSTDSEVLKQVNRPTQLEKVKEALGLLEKYGIVYKIDLMYGLPGDTFFKFLNSARFVLEHARRQQKLVAHHFMLLNNTAFAYSAGMERFSRGSSSMVIKTPTQDIFELYKTKLFIDMVNDELRVERGR